jgi:hypothetical protein
MATTPVRKKSRTEEEETAKGRKDISYASLSSKAGNEYFIWSGVH